MKRIKQLKGKIRFCKDDRDKMGKKRKKKKVSVTLNNGNYNIAILLGFPLVLCLFLIPLVRLLIYRQLTRLLLTNCLLVNHLLQRFGLTD